MVISIFAHNLTWNDVAVCSCVQRAVCSVAIFLFIMTDEIRTLIDLPVFPTIVALTPRIIERVMSGVVSR